jgi:hypothetical protein
VDSTLTVPQGDTLFIGPNVQVIFQGNYQLKVFGLLQAVGTEQDSITFTAASSLVGWGGIRFVNAHVNSKLEYCRFELGLAQGVYPNSCGGAVYMYGGIQAIKHCSFVDNWADFDGGAVYLWGGTPEFAYNLFMDNLASHDKGHAVYMGNVAGLIPNHLTIAGNGSGDGYSLYVETDDKLSMRNSIVWDSYWFLFDPGEISYCDIDSVTSDTLLIMGEGNMWVNPYFINQAAGDLRVQNYSATIDAASPLAPFSSEPAPNGGRANIGAYGNGILAAPTIPMLSFGPDTLVTHYEPDTTGLHTDLVEFGLQKINTTGNQAVTLYNIGGAALTLDSLAISNSQFSSNYDSLIDPIQEVIVVPSHGSVDITLAFMPTAVADVAGILGIHSNDATYIPQLNLHGTGVNPILKLSPDSLHFGLVSAGDSLELPVMVWNDGEDQGSIQSKLVINLGNFSYPGGANFFALDTISPSPYSDRPWYIVDTLAVHDTVHYMIRFKPFGQVNYLSPVIFSSNAGSDSIVCTGSGSSAIYHFDSDTLAFGVVPLTHDSTMYIKIWNTGALDLGLDSLVLEDELNFNVPFDTSLFHISTNDTLMLPVVFSPASTGPHNTMLHIYTDIPGSSPWNVRLIGTGTSQVNYWIGNVGEVTWTTANQPYYVVGDVTIPAGQTLTIEPGVDVEFEGNFKITVKGTLLANGESSAPINFSTILADCTWAGLRFDQGSSGSVVRYATFTRGADSLGGATSITNASPLLEHCEWYGNVSLIGGAVFLTGNSAPTFRQCLIHDNLTILGGAIYADWLTQPVLDSCQIYNNSASSGGGLYLSGTRGVVHHCDIHHNTTTLTGGGVYLGSGSTTEFHNNTIHDNTASEGAGIAIISNTRPFIHDETIFANTASVKGGGLYITEASSPLIIRALIAENVAPHSQALYTQGSSPILNYCTLLASPVTTSGWLMTSNSDDGSLVSNTILGSSDWSGNAFTAVSLVGSTMMVTYSDVWDTAGIIFPGLGNANINPQFVNSGSTPQERYTLQAGSPANTLSEPDNNGQRWPIGFTGGSSELSWDITLSMLQNPVDLSSLQFVLASTIPLMGPPYMRLEQDVPDTLGYVLVDSMFMDLNGPGVYIQPFSLAMDSLQYPCRLTITFTNITGGDTLLQQSFVATNLSGTLSSLNLGGDVILTGRVATGAGVWGVMPELYSTLKPLSSELEAVSPSYQVMSSSSQLAQGQISFTLNDELLAGRAAESCAVARWTSGSWQALPSALSADRTMLSAEISGGGTYRVVSGQGLGTVMLPSRLELSQNYPNPFNPETTIRFNLPQTGLVNLEVFDISGRLVTTLLDGQRNAGINQVVWSGLNAQGLSVSSGVYFYRLRSGGQQISKKMVLLR